MKEKFSIVAFVFLSMVNTTLLEAKTLQDVASEMGMSKSEATKVLNGVNLIIQDVKYKFHAIASSEVAYYKKMGYSGLIYDTYPLFTEGKRATIQTSSLNRPTIHSVWLSIYLENLAYISKQDGIDVRLDFGKNMYVRDIKRIANRINVNVDVLQFFKKCKRRSDRRDYCYQDITTKTFALKIKKSRGEYRYSVDSVRVKDTKRVSSEVLNNMGIKG